MQKVYHDEPHCLGDDQTTIVFTQNVTRISANTERESDEDSYQIIENNESNEYARPSLELATTFAGMIKEMMTLPENHDAWAYMNPTVYYFENPTSPAEIIGREDQHIRDFQIG